MKSGLRVSAKTNEHFDVRLEQARHQEVARQPDKLAERDLSGRKSFIGRLSGSRAPVFEHQGQSEVVLSVEVGDGVQKMLQMLSGQRHGVDDALIFVDHLVASALVSSIAQLFDLKS